MDLSGRWRAAPADEALRRAYPEQAFDDSAWTDLDVPGHWRSEPGFAGVDGSVLHRRTFESQLAAAGTRSWLTFDGIFYEAHVWLDGSYIGDTEGYFFPHSFEVTDALASRTEHTLAVEVSCDRPADRTAKRNITGVFQHWDCLDPDWNPGGIWRPVRVHHTGAVRISRLRILCIEANEQRAVVDLRTTLNAIEACTVLLRTTIAGIDHVQEQPLAAGENRVQWKITVDKPALWWPHALGPQPLHDVVVEVTAPNRDGAPSDRRIVTTGLREVRMKQWIASVNGERLFLKGSNQGPTKMQLAEATAGDFERDVLLARDAGLDMLRLHAHISRPEFYEAADRLGMLLWQDFPLQWGYARGIRKQAARQAREAVDLLGHHPSIAIWCGHNEPLALDVEPGVADASPVRMAAQFFAMQQLPTWNKSVLDATVKRALEKSDPSRPVIAHSGVLPHAGSGGTDTHLYFGWYHGGERDFPGFLRRIPRLARFVTEFGAQAVPETAGFMEPDRWPDLDWSRLARTHALQKSAFDKFVPPAEFDSFDEWREATQEYQAVVVRHHVEALRRLKYRPTGGFAQFCFADSHPAVTWSLLDHDRVPKLAYEALAAACAPVIITADRPAPSYRPGQLLALAVHVVSDLRMPIEDARARASLSWSGGSHSWTWEGDIAADSVVRVGAVRAPVPDARGQLVLELELEGRAIKASNRYEAEIIP